MALTQIKTAGIAADAVDGTKIADAAVANEHIAVDAVNPTQMAHGTDGNLITYDTNGAPGFVLTGNDGQVLTSQGAGNVPQFEDLPASNNYTHPNHSGEVTSTADGAQVIASNVVDEDNLKISNAGSNGQYLQKQSGNTGGLTWADVTSSDTLSFRNLIINGAMKINQRVATAGLSDFNPVTSAMWTLDRWFFGNGSSFDTDSMRIKQVSDSPDEFTNSLRVDIGNTATPGAGQNGVIAHRIEAQNLQQLAYGTSSAKSCTLSFWVRSNKTGTYCLQISQHDAGKYLLYEYSISSANTWEKKTITFSGNTSDAIANDNGRGLDINWHLACHSDDHVAATTSWTAKPGGGTGSNYNATSNQVNLWDHADNVWYLTGVQLEVGSTATDYEYVPLSYELMRCQRYFYKSNMFHSACMTYTPGSGDHQFTRMNTDHPVTMRANPSGVAGDFACWSWSSATGVAAANLTWSFDNGTNNAMMTMTASHSNAAAPANGPGSGHMVPCRVLNIEFQAEL